MALQVMRPPETVAPVDATAHGATVSVVIPFSKPATVGNAIDSVLRQDYPAHLLEVILVGKGSSTLRECWPQIRAIDVGPIREPGHARNLGAAKASGEILLFLDDDCEAQEGWIRENLAELENPQVGAVSGMIEGKSKAFFARCVDFSNFGMCQIQRRQERPICTASFAIPRDLFEHIGGFDTKLRIHEDIDICHRLQLNGYKTVYQPAVRVRHDHGRKSLRAMVGYLYWGGRQGGLTIEERYAHLSPFYRGLLRFRHPLLYLAMVVPFAAAATVRTLMANLREHKGILLLSPFIFVGKLSCHLGIWSSLLGKQLRKWEYDGVVQNARRLIQYSLLARFMAKPRELTLFVTSKCNAKCRHCFYWESLNNKDDLSFEQIEALSHSLGKLDKLLISGGEPFLRRDLPEILGLFFENNDVSMVSIPTNGLNPTLVAEHARRILELANGKTVNISISLDGMEQLHDGIRGVPGAFSRAIETYRAVNELKKGFGNLRICWNSVVMNRNQDDLFRLMDEMPSAMPQVNVPALSLLRGEPLDGDLKLPDLATLRELHKHKLEKFPGEQPLIWKIADWMVFNLALETLRRDVQVVRCEAGRIFGVVEHNGNVKHCEMLPPIGNLNEKGFEEIWQSPESRRERQRIARGSCRCTHECHLFPSILAHPIGSVIALMRAGLRDARGS